MVLAVAAENNLVVEERLFSVAEAIAAREAFITSASSFVLPVVRIDGSAIGDGRPGPTSRLARRGKASGGQRHHQIACVRRQNCLFEVQLPTAFRSDAHLVAGGWRLRL